MSKGAMIRRKSWASWFPIARGEVAYKPSYRDLLGLSLSEPMGWGERKFVPTQTPFLEGITTKAKRRGMKP